MTQTTPLTVDGYRYLVNTIRHIPKRARSKMKRNVKRAQLKIIDPNNENRHAALRIYRRMWTPVVSKENVKDGKPRG